MEIIAAFTKGRIEYSALERLSKIGYDVSELTDKEKKGRKLIFSVPDTELKIILSKPTDVLTYVSRGICDIGIVGRDTLLEEENITGYYEIADLEFGKCVFAFAAKKGVTSNEFFSSHKSRIIASKYPNTARKYFRSRGVDAEIVKIEGSVELAPILGLSDGIVDIVETGSTLKANGLEVVEVITDVSSRLIVNRAALKIKKSEITQLAEKFRRV